MSEKARKNLRRRLEAETEALQADTGTLKAKEASSKRTNTKKSEK